ncbi:interleukin-18-binding protein [Thamnophis elegans]|uniref:interleukin-18-binding protein n=1 Tax=Thamnophis elegans TaxID=35005 RepID=UPI001377E27D|nr:interleukin-18-binding protein [Thamnophis elegans]
MAPSAPDARPLVGCLLLLLLRVSLSIQAPAAAKETQITSDLRLKAAIGQKVQVPCVGTTAYPESGIMYWLANGTFVDQLYPNGTVKEEATEEKGSQLTRKLTFSSLTAQDLCTTFDCFITDPSGVFRATIQWSHSSTKGAEVKLPKISARTPRPSVNPTKEFGS